MGRKESKQTKTNKTKYNSKQKPLMKHIFLACIISYIVTILGLFMGIYLSKALTCLKIFLYKQELLFCQGEGYL